jgi:hypothetical protein
MKKSTHKWLLVLLALSLLVPVYSMADMKLNLMTKGGIPIVTEDAVIKNFFVYSDGTHTYVSGVVDGTIKFVPTDPDIGIEELNGTPLDNIVTVTQGSAYSFKVVSDTPEATFTAPVNPGGTWQNPQFSPNTTVVGNFLAVFQADVTTPPKSSQIVVLIKVVPPGYTLTINQSTNGTVSAPKTTGFSLTSPESVLVTATPATGYRLASWGGALSGTTSPASLLMDGNKTVTATFELIPPPFTLTINNQSSDGTISAPKTTGFPGYYPYESVLVTATPTTGHRFVSWGGALSGTTSPATLLMDGNKTVTATFEDIPANTYTLTVLAGTGGTAANITSTQGPYAAGTSVTIQATPNTSAGYSFSNWDCSNAYPTGNPATFTMPSANVTVTAIFTSGSSGNPGTEGNPIPLIQPLSALNGYGYEKHYTGEYLIPRGGTAWFKIDPSLISGLTTPLRMKITASNYDAYQVNVSGNLYVVNRSNPTAKTLVTALKGSSNFQVTYYIFTYNPSQYYLVSLTENGTENQFVTIYWTIF